MTYEPTRPRATIAGVPVHALLTPFPVACFTGALITDITYANTAVIQWANFSAWLLAFGMLTGSIAALFGLIDFFFGRRNAGAARPVAGWWHMGGNLALLAVALVNNVVHARDGWTSVVPTGLTLSAITVLLLCVTSFLGHRLRGHSIARDAQ